MKYQVSVWKEELYRYDYEVEAVSEEKAEELVMSGKVDYTSKKFISGEIVNVEIEEIK